MLGSKKMKQPRMTAIFKNAIWKNQKSGFYVEIGAFDGKKKNSTIILEKAGWQGVCVEPTPQSFLQLIKNRNCHCENVAIWNEDTTIDFSVYKDDLAWNGITQTLDQCHIERLDQSITIQVPTKSWNSMNFPKQIDYLQIDVEGAELKIMDCIDWNNQKISYICIEDNGSKIGDMTYYNYMIKLGYQLIVQQHVDFLWFKE
jgi:FkbM family methyltransferase